MSLRDTITSEAATYSQRDWGDYISGTKEQIQAMGIGIGEQFPGETGGPGPRCTLETRDPRGFAVSVTQHRFDRAGVFSAFMTFPGWPDLRIFDRREKTVVAPGVKKSERCHWFDEYLGTATALTAAGLVRAEHFPGQPGMRKVRVTILADGTIPICPPNTCDRRARLPGAICIERASKTTFRVRVNVPKEEKTRREAAERLATDERRRQAAKLTRPARLIDMANVFERDRKRSNLSLIWAGDGGLANSSTESRRERGALRLVHSV